MVLPKGSADSSESHMLPPTHLFKPASFKGSTNTLMHSMTTVQTCPTEKESFHAYFDATTNL